jgi:hypothetical protein
MLQQISRRRVPVRALADEALSDERMDLLIALVTAVVLMAVYAVAMWIDTPASS